MKLQKRVVRLEPNTLGTDYFVGDLHGEREMLETLLEHVGFGGHDRLISVGDLVDRGPDSMGLLRLFHGNPNFFAVVGNHDALMWGAFQNHMEAQKGWRGMGNEWSYPLSDDEKRFAVEVVGTFPLGMEVPLPDGRRVAVIHAGVRPGATWRDVCDWESDWIDVTLDYELRHNEYAIWGRHHSLGVIQATRDLPNLSLWEKLKIHEGLQPLVDVDLLVSGHTPLPGRKPLLGANRLFIDTGGYHKDGWLTLVDPLNRRAWRAPNELMSDQYGVEEIEWPVLISAEPFQLTPEQIREAKLEDLRHRQKLTKALGYFPPTDVA